MSLIASLLTSAAGGGLLGVLGQAVNNGMEIWRAKWVYRPARPFSPQGANAMAIIKEGVRLLIPLEEYKALVAQKRASFIASSAATSHVEATEAYAPALVSREENETRKTACNGCEWKGDAGTCGCRPICNHEAVRTMESQKAPNYWLKSSTCPAGKWTEEAKQ